MTTFSVQPGQYRSIQGMLRAGDVVIFGPGEHNLGSIFIQNISFCGMAGPTSTVLRGQIELRKNCQITGLTIKADPYSNAVKASNGSTCRLFQCILYGDQTGKYPALWSENSSIEMHRSTIYADRAKTGVYLSRTTSLTASNSSLAKLAVDGSTVNLQNCQAYEIAGCNRGKVHSRGTLALYPGSSVRVIELTGESYCEIVSLRVNEKNAEVLCEDSSLQIGNSLLQGENKLTIFVKGNSSSIGANKRHFKIVDLDKPKTVRWNLADARNFGKAVAPNLRPGDTVTLDRGDYYLDDYDGALALSVNLSGTGPETVIHGTIELMDQASIVVKNLAIIPHQNKNGINTGGGQRLSMKNVELHEPEGSSVPVLYAGSGTTVMIGCRVVASSDKSNGTVNVDKNARLEAVDSEIGWFKTFDHGAAELDNCTAHQVWAEGESTIDSGGTLKLFSNSCDLRSLVVQEKASVQIMGLEFQGELLEGYVDNASLTIDSLSFTQKGMGAIHHVGDAHINIPTEHIKLIDTGVKSNAKPTARPENAESLDVQEEEPSYSSDNASDPLAEINSLIGLTTVKRQILDFLQMVHFNRRREQSGYKGNSPSRHSLFVGNPGTGKTTVARLLGKILFQSGAIEKDIFVEVSRKDLVSENIGGSAIKTQAVLESARGGVLFIDEAYTLYQKSNNEFGQEALDTILAFIENFRDEIMVIFAGYSDRMQELLSMNEGLKSRIPNRFDFEDYSSGEIVEIGLRSLASQDFVVDKDMYREVVEKCYSRSSDDSNGRWIRNLNERLQTIMARRLFGIDDNDPATLTRITNDDLFELVGGDYESKQVKVAELLEQLDGMVGLQTVKAWAHELVDRVKINQKLMEMGTLVTVPSYHMLFMGNPGTGKTTVAGIIAKLFYNLDILENPSVIVTERAKLVGAFIGQTEERTSRAIEEAMGGVLFIDEAYQLNAPETENDFGRIAINTLLSRLENDRGKFIAIFAGYTQDMQRFLDSNQGLRSRIQLQIEFPDYSSEEIAQIVSSILSKKWEFNENILSKVASDAYTAETVDRSNGRWADKFAKKVETAHIHDLASRDEIGSDLRFIRDEVIRSVAV